MQRTVKKKPKANKVLMGILPPTISANEKGRIALYTIVSLVLVYFFVTLLEKSMVTKTGIVLETLSFLFVSPELFGIKDISKFQKRALKLTEHSTRSFLNFFERASKVRLLQFATNIFYWMAWPMSRVYSSPDDKKIPSSYDWINSVEKSLPIATLNLFLLWTPGIALLLRSIPREPSYDPALLQLQIYVLEPQYPFYGYLSLFIIGLTICYFSLSHTFATITWHLNAVATYLKEDRERRLLAIFGIWLFVFGSFLQFIAA